MNENNVELLDGEIRNTVVETGTTQDNSMSYTTTITYDTHVVQSGETLSEITYDKTGDGTYDSYMQVANQNNIEDPNLIYPGDEIRYEVSSETIYQNLDKPNTTPTSNNSSTSAPQSSVPLSTGNTSGTNSNLGAVGVAANSSSGGGFTSGGSGGNGRLSIESATLGYDTQGMQDAVNRLNLFVFTEIVVNLRNAIVPLNLAVDSMWAGQAANAFKNKFERDVEVMADTLDQLRDQVEGQFATIASNIDRYDGEIADKINTI